MNDIVEANGLKQQSLYDQLRGKWRTMLTGGKSFDPLDPDYSEIIGRITETTNGYWESLLKSNNRSCLWEDLSEWSNSATLTANFTRIWHMALACNTYGSALYQHSELQHDLMGALDWMYANRYNPGTERYGNWWDWEIGVPLKLLDCTALMYEKLSLRQQGEFLGAVDHFKPSVAPTSSGANRVWESTIIAVRGVLGKDGGKIAAACAELRPVFSYVTKGDGFYRDGSYIQHDTYAYTGGYGQSLIHELSNVMVLLHGSPWEVEDTERRHVFRWIYDSYEPLIYRGSMMDMSMGRVTSREHSQNHDIGHIIIRSVIRLSQIAPSDDARAFKSMIKEWIRTDTWAPFYKDASLNTAVLSKQIMADASIPPRGELCMHKHFANMARTVHMRPGYAFAISMHSDKISNYESINHENLRGWHTSDGMTYLYNGDLSQYCDAFWPTVNSCRLPGTTVLYESEVPANLLSDQSWAGGTELLGLYGASGMSLHPNGQSLFGKKSWFMFDEEIVAIGSGIRSNDGWKAETIIENRMLNHSGSNSLTVDGARKPDAIGWSEEMKDIVWAHLKGNTAESDIGYYFPESATVWGHRESRSDTWSSINLYDNDTRVFTRNFLSLWVEHGVDPADAAYAYVLLPNKAADEVKKYAEIPNVAILENTGEIHAVKHKTLNITGIHYWVDGGKKIEGIRADRKSSVMVNEGPDTLTMAVSDPTFRNEGVIHIEIDREVKDILSQDPGIKILRLQPTIQLEVDMKEANGRTFQAQFTVSSGNFA